MTHEEITSDSAKTDKDEPMGRARQLHNRWRDIPNIKTTAWFCAFVAFFTGYPWLVIGAILIVGYAINRAVSVARYRDDVR